MDGYDSKLQAKRTTNCGHSEIVEIPIWWIHSKYHVSTSRSLPKPFPCLFYRGFWTFLFSPGAVAEFLGDGENGLPKSMGNHGESLFSRGLQNLQSQKMTGIDRSHNVAWLLHLVVFYPHSLHCRVQLPCWSCDTAACLQQIHLRSALLSVTTASCCGSFLRLSRSLLLSSSQPKVWVLDASEANHCGFPTIANGCSSKGVHPRNWMVTHRWGDIPIVLWNACPSIYLRTPFSMRAYFSKRCSAIAAIDDDGYHPSMPCKPSLSTILIPALRCPWYHTFTWAWIRVPKNRIANNKHYIIYNFIKNGYPPVNQHSYGNQWVSLGNLHS